MDKWIEKLIEFIKIDTTNPPGRNYREGIDFLEPLFEDVGFVTEKIKIPPKIAKDRVNLLAHRRNPGKPRLLVYSHIDVVPADSDWEPFKPKIVEGKIFGRGVADMKGSLIAFLMAADSLKDKAWPWDATVMVTTDEETNQKRQLLYLLEKKIDGVKGAVFLGLDSTFGYVSIGGLGHINVKIVVLGKSVHSGISHLGVNAVEKSVLVLNSLMGLKKRVESRFSKIPVNPDLKIRTMQAKLNIDKINGGLKINIVPDKCVLEVDRRLLPEEKVSQAKQEIERALWPLKEKVNFRLEFIHSMKGYGKVSPAARRLAKCVEKVLGKGNLYGVMGSGDLLTLASDFDWEFVGCGVGRDKESNIHGREENARVEDILKLKDILCLFLGEIR